LAALTRPLLAASILIEVLSVQTTNLCLNHVVRVSKKLARCEQRLGGELRKLRKVRLFAYLPQHLTNTPALGQAAGCALSAYQKHPCWLAVLAHFATSMPRNKFGDGHGVVGAAPCLCSAPLPAELKRGASVVHRDYGSLPCLLCDSACGRGLCCRPSVREPLAGPASL
jgi:hypothetical protein